MHPYGSCDTPDAPTSKSCIGSGGNARGVAETLHLQGSKAAQPQCKCLRRVQARAWLAGHRLASACSLLLLESGQAA